MKKLKILFVIDNIGFLEIFSIPILSSLAKKYGHYVELIEFSKNKKDFFKKVNLYKPDIIAYSICSNEADKYLKINNLLKEKISFFSLFGGPHPTFFPTFIEEKGVDAICKGEADICFVEFLENFGTDKMYKTNNFSFKLENQKIIENPLTELVENIDDLPFPDRDIIYSKSIFLSSNPIKSFFAGRGCPYKCNYCFNHIYNELYKGKGKILRTKSVSYLFNEIKSISQKYPLSFIKFHDDIFGFDKNWLREFSTRYPEEIGLPFLCYARPNMITEEYCELLKKAGCYSVCIAIESGNENIRKSILNRHISNEEIIKACENLKKSGLRIYTLNMIGLPKETEKEILQTIEINQKIKVDFADASIFQPYPGTKITEYCKDNNYLDKNFNKFESQFSTSVLSFDQNFKDKIFILHKLFSILVDYPNLKFLLNFFYKLRFLKFILNFIYRFYYGYNLQPRIYNTKIPFKVRLIGAFLLIFSKNRT